MRLHYLQHEIFETPGCILAWASQKGFTLTHTMLYEADARLPQAKDIDALIVMGGSMGANDDDKYLWMSAEKKLITEVINLNKPVLGICLGAQLIANVLGARVYGNHTKEIGWYPVNLTPEGTHNAVFNAFPNAFHTFHWHGDTFDLPRGAVHIAYSQDCVHQAFMYGTNVLGIQYHPEIRQEDIQMMVAHDSGELAQLSESQKNDMDKHQDWCNANNAWLCHVLDRWVG
ncbi:MAG: type 1 glutamine amidotransferase [Cytophagales bacterium]|nr:type 1 glutamine amidotransferase [Cytophagales bacterium]